MKVGEIEKDVPVAQVYPGPLATYRAIVAPMRVGDSRFIDPDDVPLRTAQKCILRAAQMLGYKVTTRKLVTGGLRIWRLA